MHGFRQMTAVAVLMSVAAFSAGAWAQNQEVEGPLAPNEPVEARGVGIAGGAIVGAELILLLEAAIGVEPTWPWVVFPLLGAAGGGVGGYFIENSSPEGAIALLVVGLAAVIPTALAVSASRAYDPEREGAVPGDAHGAGSFSFELPPSTDGYEEETTTEVESRPDEIPDEATHPPGVDDGAGPEARAADPLSDPRARRLASGALLHVEPGLGLGIGIPAPAIRAAPILDQSMMLGLKRPGGLEVSFPLINVELP